MSPLIQHPGFPTVGRALHVHMHVHLSMHAHNCTYTYMHVSTQMAQVLHSSRPVGDQSTLLYLYSLGYVTISIPVWGVDITFRVWS